MEEKIFICKNCSKEVSLNAVGTRNRNHCPYCLWSSHVDKKTGDRENFCHGLMEPIGLTFKKDEGIDKYGEKRQGEIMVVHKCQICGKVSKNRIAGDDNPEVILAICEEINKKEVKRQLFGK